MKEEELKKYYSSIYKMIRSGNPKYMAYITREYMKYANNSSVVAESILDMIRKETKNNARSPYIVLLDSDGTVNLEAMNDISKITNLSQFISQVQELSKYNVDFSKMSADDLIKEGEQLIEEIENEVEDEVNTADSSSEDSGNAQDTAMSGIKKLGILAAIGGTIGIAARSALNRIKTTLTKLKGNKKLPEQGEKDEEYQPEIKVPEKIDNAKAFEEVCPKVEVDELKTIKDMEKKRETEKTKILKNDTYGDGDPDGDDLDI